MRVHTWILSVVCACACLGTFCGQVGAAEPATKPVAKGNLEELKLDLPEPKEVPSPPNAGTTAEKPSGKREAFFVPKGCANVALKKPVTASDERPIIGNLPQITDGDKVIEDGHYVELGPDVQWVQIDLKEKFDLYAIVVWHLADKRIFKGVVVQVSDDADFVKDVKTLFNNDHENLCGLGMGKDRQYYELNEGLLVDAKGISARYIRLYSNGSTSNAQNPYTEVEAWGMPAKK